MTIDNSSEEQYDKEGNAKHYKETRIETIDMMLAIWGTEAVMMHCEMTAFKYRMRTGHKEGQHPVQEMKKTKWYEAKAKELQAKLEDEKVIPGIDFGKMFTNSHFCHLGEILNTAQDEK